MPFDHSQKQPDETDTDYALRLVRRQAQHDVLAAALLNMREGASGGASILRVAEALDIDLTDVLAVQRCVIKLSKPYAMHECGEPCVYVGATPPEVPYSGWYHLDRSITHHAFPKKEL